MVVISMNKRIDMAMEDSHLDNSPKFLITAYLHLSPRANENFNSGLIAQLRIKAKCNIYLKQTIYLTWNLNVEDLLC